MYFTFNELSLKKIENPKKAIQVLMNFADVTSILYSLGIRNIKVWDVSLFKTFQISEGYMIVDWLKKDNFSTEKERLKARILKSLLTRTSFFQWGEEERKQIANYPLLYLSFDNKSEESQGLKIAYLNNTVGVSLYTDDIWGVSSLSLLHITEIGTVEIEQTVSVNHAALVSNIDENRDWIQSKIKSRIIFSEWRPAEVLFPNLEFSNQLVQDNNWAFFHEEKNRAKSPQEKITIIKTYGKKVAERNNYAYDSRVSNINSTHGKLRKIYAAGIGKNRIYLSVDFETGGFEVCNYLGEHLGEYFFDGKKVANPKADHNIRIKS